MLVWVYPKIGKWNHVLCGKPRQCAEWGKSKGDFSRNQRQLRLDQIKTLRLGRKSETNQGWEEKEHKDVGMRPNFRKQSFVHQTILYSLHVHENNAFCGYRHLQLNQSLQETRGARWASSQPRWWTQRQYLAHLYEIELNWVSLLPYHPEHARSRLNEIGLAAERNVYQQETLWEATAWDKQEVMKAWARQWQWDCKQPTKISENKHAVMLFRENTEKTTITSWPQQRMQSHQTGGFSSLDCLAKEPDPEHRRSEEGQFPTFWLLSLHSSQAGSRVQNSRSLYGTDTSISLHYWHLRCGHHSLPDTGRGQGRWDL